MIVALIALAMTTLFFLALTVGLARQLARAHNELAAMQGFLNPVRMLIKAVDNLMVFRSTDSFTGTVPKRNWEVSHNDAIEHAAKIANDIAVELGDKRQPSVIPDHVFRNIGGTGHDYAAEHEAQEGK